MTIVTSPFPPYQNPPIQSDFYVPNFFIISALTLGETTTVTTSVDHNFVVGQIIRFIVPLRYRTRELNEKQAIVFSIPSATQLVCYMQSYDFTPFFASPYVASITNISQEPDATITADNAFRIGDLVKFTEVEGMTEINDQIYKVISGSSSNFVINADTSSFTAYTEGGTATFARVYPNPYVYAIGDLNSGAINVDNQDQQLYINGSFRNISPV
jgi:hypothetical protein